MARGLSIGRLEALENRVTPATFLVTSNSDSGSGTLREAIVLANTLTGADTITFAPGFSSVQLSSGEMAISDALTIEGPGANFLSIFTGSSHRLFNLSSAPVNTPISISGLRFHNFAVTGNGGTIVTTGQALTIRDCDLSTTTAFGGGGAVAVTGGSLTVERSVFNLCVATGNGGAIMATGGASVSITDCTFSKNVADGQGGGLYSTSGGVSVIGSTFTGNMAANGGGLHFDGAVLTGFSIRNSTFSSNSAATQGGGISLSNLLGTLDVQNSTVTNNTAGTSGGGVARISGFGVVAVASSVVTGNIATGSASEDFFTAGTVTATRSAIGTKTGITTFTPDATTNALLGQDFKLGPLAANGGLTLTHVPAADSPVIDQGSAAPTLLTDQRGAPFVRSFGAGVDIGAAEFQNLFVVTNLADSGAGSLRDLIAAAGLNPGPDTLTFATGILTPSSTITLTTGELKVAHALTIQSPDPKLMAISGNNARRILSSTFAPPGTLITIMGLTLKDGSAQIEGGALFINKSDVVLQNCVIRNNTAAVRGGAVYLSGGSLSVSQCAFTGNSANQGGVIEHFSPFNAVDSTFAFNVAKVSIGGAIHSWAPLTIRNSTISGNSAAQRGGGIRLNANATPAIIQNSTITANTADEGSGISQNNSTINLFLESSLISDNVGTVSLFDIQSIGTVNAVASMLGKHDPATKLNADALTLGLLNQSAMLGPLRNNGGPTLTHMPAFGSPALNQGINTSPLLLTDQRGKSRSFGVIDMGSVEVQTAAPSGITFIVNQGQVQRSRITHIRVESATPFEAAALEFPGAVTLTRTAAPAGGTVGTTITTATGMQINSSASVTTTLDLIFPGPGNPGLDFGSLGDGRWQLAVPSAKYTSPLNSPLLRRLFGDFNADGTVDAIDLADLGAVFGSTGASPFDFNNDLTVDALDFGEFGNRFGLTL